jgi:hypothetical protein
MKKTILLGVAGMFALNSMAQTTKPATKATPKTPPNLPQQLKLPQLPILF